MQCIFCLEQRSADQFGAEHVFSEAIGGTLTIASVCRRCNNWLGTAVDPLLSEHAVVRLIRERQGIAGKSGRVPRLKRDVRAVLEADPEQLVAWRWDAALGREALHVEPRIVDTAEGRQLVVDARDGLRGLEAVNRWHRRQGLPEAAPEDLDGLIARRLALPGPNRVRLDVRADLVRFKIAIAKIVYEVGHHWLGDAYLTDPTGDQLRRFVRSAPKTGAEIAAAPVEVLTLGNPADAQEPAGALGIGSDDFHYATMLRTADRVVCVVRIFDLFLERVLVSQDPARYPGFRRGVWIDGPTAPDRFRFPS